MNPANITITTIVSIDLQKLTAMLVLASKDDIRYYLNGVKVEATKSDTRLASTNGHLGGMMRNAGFEYVSNAFQEGQKAYCEFIIPRETIERLHYKHNPRNPSLDQATIWIERGKDNLDAYSIHLSDKQVLPFTPVDGKFPDMRRVLATQTEQGKAACFNPEYLMLFKKLAVALGERKTIPEVLAHGTRSARVLIGSDDFEGVLMPIRTGFDDRPVTDFGYPQADDDPAPEAPEEEASNEATEAA